MSASWTYYSILINVIVSVIVVVLAPLLYILTGTVVVGIVSLLNPVTAGVNHCVAALVVIASAITPLPGVGSVVIDLPESADRVAELE